MSPIVDIQKRLHEAGRIRIGKTVTAGNKTRPTKLDSFRFTSQNEEAIRIIAAVYGGKAAPWADAPAGNQWEVITEASAVRVMVPPEEMGFSQWYELWKAGGCERRCDGEEMANGEPCQCDPEARDCKPHTRLSVMLVDLPESGLWRLDTSGFYAAQGLSAGFELARLIAASSGRSVFGATLRLDQRELKRPGQTVRKFAVPVLAFDIDPSALVGQPVEKISAEGLTPIVALPAPSLAEQLTAAEAPPDPPKRANGVEPVKATGLRPKPVQQKRPEMEPPAPSGPENGATATVDALPLPNIGKAGEIGALFDSLDGTAASTRWSVLRKHGWSTSDGKDIAAWVARKSPDDQAVLVDALLQLRAPV